MLFKDLKSIMTEADETTETQPAETPATPDQETQVQPTKETPKIAKRDKEAVKTASDGVGQEVFDMAAKISEFLQTNLRPSYPSISDIKADKGLITIVGGAKAQSANGFDDGLKMYLAAAMGDEMKNFEDPLISTMGNDIKILIRNKEETTEA